MMPVHHEILAYIEQYVREQDDVPLLDEIATVFDLSTAYAASLAVDTLCRAGHGTIAVDGRVVHLKQILSARQEAVLECIRRGFARDGRCPIQRVIGQRCGIDSIPAVTSAISDLAKKGFLRRTGDRKNPVSLCDDALGSASSDNTQAVLQAS